MCRIDNFAASKNQNLKVCETKKPPKNVFVRRVKKNTQQQLHMAEAKEPTPPLSHKRTQLEEGIDDSGTMTCTSPYTTPVNDIDEKNDAENPPSIIFV